MRASVGPVVVIERFEQPSDRAGRCPVVLKREDSAAVAKYRWRSQAPTDMLTSRYWALHGPMGRVVFPGPKVPEKDVEWVVPTSESRPALAITRHAPSSMA